MNSTKKRNNQDFDSAVACAVASLARRERFSAEVGRLLTEKGFQPEVVEQAINHLAGRNILNDGRCAVMIVARMTAKGNVGRAKIEAALGNRGASPDIIAAALPPEPHSEDLLMLLQKHFPRGGDFAKAVRYLCSRGFDEAAAVSAAETFTNS